MKCPICGGNLEIAIMSLKLLGCPKCHIFGCVELYEKFEDTKKELDDLSDKIGKLKSKLDIAADALIYLGNNAHDIDEHIFIENTLKQIYNKEEK